MKKRPVKKLTLHRETLKNLTADSLKAAKAGAVVAGSGDEYCNPTCTSTLSCTL